ncbi:hypothetical protein KESI111651_16270 [Kerstersia similis]
MYQHRDNSSHDFWAWTSIEQELIEYQQKVYGNNSQRQPVIRKPIIKTSSEQHPTIKRYIVTP